jgi:hypothetical protein
MMADNQAQEIELREMRSDISDVKRELAKVAEALVLLARLEERHAFMSAAMERSFSAVKKIEERLSVLELAQPVQRLASGWVVNIVWCAGGMLVMLVFKKMGVL